MEEEYFVYGKEPTYEEATFNNSISNRLICLYGLCDIRILKYSFRCIFLHVITSLIIIKKYIFLFL